MRQNELRELVTASNPLPDPSVLLPEESEVRTLFEEVMRRADDPQASMYLLGGDVNWSSIMETKLEVIDVEPSPLDEERKWWPKAALVAAFAAIVLLVFVLQPDDSPPDPVATDDGAVSTTVPVVTSQEALAVADAYFAAFAAGDYEALMALFVPDPEFDGQFGIADDEQVFAWNAAQGTTLSQGDCTTLDVDQLVVSCSTLNHDALVQAVDGPPVPIQVFLTISPDGITRESASFGSPDFNSVFTPFQAWMAVNHPQAVDSIGFGNWTSLEEAEENGRLTARYAAEWADYLEANGCAYNEGC
ncbi:MAG: hypothetical protein ACR2P0_19835 [Acidimicrobiales bacterium]